MKMMHQWYQLVWHLFMISFISWLTYSYFWFSGNQEEQPPEAAEGNQEGKDSDSDNSDKDEAFENED